MGIRTHPYRLKYSLSFLTLFHSSVSSSKLLLQNDNIKPRVFFDYILYSKLFSECLDDSIADVFSSEATNGPIETSPRVPDLITPRD